MKKEIIFLSLAFSCSVALTQQSPNASGGTNSGSGWWRGGNTQGNSANVMATTWNSPIYWYTDGYAGTGTYQAQSLRMKLSGTFGIPASPQYVISGYGSAQGVNTSGYLGLGHTSNGPSGNLWAVKGPFSLLHLNGRNGTFVQEGGFRPWMQAGISLTDNQDFSYIGLRQVGSGNDITETVIAWGDNQFGPDPGPDDMVFRFSSDGNGNTTISSTDLQTPTDFDGLHIARFTGTGEFGLGNTFGTNPVGTPANLYVRPQSLAHYSLSNLRSVWQQFTNRNTATGSGTGENVFDGLRIGIIGNANLNVNGTAAIYNQETRALLFSTNANTNTMNVLNGTTQERLRITSAGTPTHLSSGGFGIYNPAAVPANTTRMAISHNPSQPVTRPLSLLHLGYNTGLGSTPLGATDGWRPWMDIGTFTTNGTDNIYVGLKNEGTDRFDAVVSWGDNQAPGPITNEGPDNLRFIFTSTTSSIINPGDPVSMSANGLETGRFYPGYDTTFTYQQSTPLELYGRFGVGNFTASGVNEHPTHKLDVIGNGRFRFLPDSLYLAGPSVNKIVMADSIGVLRWMDIDSLPASGAGNYCAAASNPLTDHYEVPLNGFNYHFTGQGGNGLNKVAIGWDCTVLPGFTPPQAKLDVIELGFYQTFGSPVSIAGRFWSSAPSGASQSIGVVGMAEGGGSANFGVMGQALPASGSNPPTGPNYAGYFNGDVLVTGNVAVLSDENLKENIDSLTGALDIIRQLKPKQFEYTQSAHPGIGLPGGVQYGLIAQEVEQILPELVTENYLSQVDSTGLVSLSSISYKGLEYEQIIPFLIGGIQEQQDVIESQANEIDSLHNVIDDLSSRLSQLENCLSGILPFLCQLSQKAIEQNGAEVQEQLRNIIDVELSNGTAIVLNQNVPNPFAESTVITYSIPESVQKAQIIFHDAAGALIKTVDIRERGNGQINVYANDLSTGTYTYSLVADDKIVATKRMVKQ